MNYLCRIRKNAAIVGLEHSTLFSTSDARTHLTTLPTIDSFSRSENSAFNSEKWCYGSKKKIKQIEPPWRKERALAGERMRSPSGRIWLALFLLVSSES